MSFSGQVMQRKLNFATALNLVNFYCGNTPPVKKLNVSEFINCLQNKWFLLNPLNVLFSIFSGDKTVCKFYGNLWQY